MAQHFGYMVPKPGGTHDIVVMSKEADVQVLSEFEQLTAVVRELQPLAIALAATERDYLGLAGLPEAEAARLDEVGSVDLPISLVADLLVEATRVLSAFLASASALLGQATKYVSRIHGSESVEGVDWHTRRQALHAGSRGYRILYELRNFAQHYALPISAVRVHGELGADDRMSFTTGAHVGRDELLSSGYKWGGRKADIEAQDMEFDVLPLAAEYWQCLQELTAALATYRGAELLECRRYLRAIRRVIKAPSNARLYLFERGEAPSDAPPTNVTVVPEEQFFWMFQVLYRQRLAEMEAAPRKE